MASSLHLDSQDLKTTVARQFGMDITQKDGAFIVTLPNKISVDLRSLRLAGEFTFDKWNVEVQSCEITETGIDIKFSAK